MTNKRCFFIAFAGLLAVVLGACEQLKTQSNGADVLKNNFGDFLGNYKILGCSASQNQSGNCKFETATVAIETQDSHNTLVISTYHQTLGENSALKHSLSIPDSPGVTCNVTYGRSACTMDSDANTKLNTTFTASGDQLYVQTEAFDSNHPESTLTLNMTLQRVQPQP